MHTQFGTNGLKALRIILTQYVSSCSLSGYPGHYHYFLGQRMEECPTYGCIFELTIQLVVIVTVKELLVDLPVCLYYW